MISKNKYLKGLFILIGFSILTAIGYGLYIFNKPARDALSEKAIQISANELFSQYSNNQNLADNLYLDKTIEVKGTIIKLGENQDGQQYAELETLQENGTIFCTLMQAENLNIQQEVTLKGICKGYRDQLMVFDVVLVDCYLLD